MLRRFVEDYFEVHYGQETKKKEASKTIWIIMLQKLENYYLVSSGIHFKSLYRKIIILVQSSHIELIKISFNLFKMQFKLSDVPIRFFVTNEHMYFPFSNIIFNAYLVTVLVITNYSPFFKVLFFIKKSHFCSKDFLVYVQMQMYVLD